MRIRRRYLGAPLALVLGLGAAAPAVALTSGTLPGGTSISVGVGSPANGTTIHYGDPITFSGTANIGQADATPNTALVYDLDVSGSTQLQLGPSAVTACGNPNGDTAIGSQGGAGTVLDCEITALANLNQRAIQKGSVKDVGAVALGGHSAGAGNGVGDSVAGDVQPAAGSQLLTAPDANLDSAGGTDVEQVLNSAFVPLSGSDPRPGFSQFSPVYATDRGTNYEDSVIVATNTANQSTATTKIVVLVSDGDANVGNTNLGTTYPAFSGLVSNVTGQFGTTTSFRNWVAAVAGNVKFFTFAVGAAASCSPTWNGYGTLQLIADATGGTCTRVTDPASLPNVVPDLVASQLTGVTGTFDGGNVPLTVTPALPQTGPATVTWTSTAPIATPVAPGSHTFCANATGKDGGGAGSVSDCSTVRVEAADPGGPYGGDSSSSFEGTPVAISASTFGGATFDHWSYAPGAGVDAGASCSFADPSQASTAVTCTDDGTFVLTAHTAGPLDAVDANLVLYNKAPALATPTLSPTGTVFAGTPVTVSATFTDAGTNDTHTCTIQWSDGAPAVSFAATEVAGSGTGTCSATRNLGTGSYSATVTVEDDDHGSDTASTTAGANGSITVVDFPGITPGTGSGGGYAGVEGSPVSPTINAPAGTTLSWSVDTLGTGVSCPVTGATSSTPSITCDDNGSFMLKLDATLGSTVHSELPLVIANANPVVATPTLSPSGSVLPGTSVTASATFTDAGTRDTHTCTVQWSDQAVPSAGFMAETPGTGTGTCSAPRTLTGAGAYTVTVVVTDDDLGSGSASSAGSAGGTITVNPVTIGGGTGTGGSFTTVEGTPVYPTAANVPAGASLVWSAAPDAGTTGACTVGGTSTAPSITCNDNGSFTITVTVTVGTTVLTATKPLTVTNADPVVGNLALSSALVPVGTAVTVTAPFTDAGTNDTHTCSVVWDDGLAPVLGSVVEASGSGTCKRTDTFTTPGTYRVTATVTDDDGGSGSNSYAYLVVYDASAGFVTGGGTINVARGSYVADPTVSGTASFGFVSRYQKGATVPTGNTEFQFRAAGFNFSSTSYQWLVVSGAKAQYKGTGTVNGAGSYGFLLTATDGQVSGGGGADQFRIKVWDTATGTTVFDNVMGASSDIDSANPQAIASGSIVIHK